MEQFFNSGKQYLYTMRERGLQRNVQFEFQLVGLEVAALFGDYAHKALYIKLTKQHGKDKILRLAKMVAGQNNVRNKGAYFMRLLHGN